MNEKTIIRRQRQVDEKTETLRITLRPDTMKNLKEMADSLGISRSGYIATLIDEDTLNPELRKRKMEQIGRFRK